MDPMTPDDVKAALPDIEMTFFDDSTATSQQAADQIGCALGQIVKSLAFLVDGAPVLVLASGDGMVDTKKLAALHDVGRKKVKTAKPDQLIAIWGYPPGAVPPVGHRTPDLPTLIDTSLQRYETVYAAGGAQNAIFGIALADLVAATGGTFVDVRKEE
jgi:prolyl-tRNA editing enzyme YbaK/EbsC (Cys-tRNA(Pro) deacylase)